MGAEKTGSNSEAKGDHEKNWYFSRFYSIVISLTSDCIEHLTDDIPFLTRLTQNFNRLRQRIIYNYCFRT